MKGLERFTECEHKHNNHINVDCIHCNFAWCLARIKYLEDTLSKPSVPSVEEIEKILQENIWTTLSEYGVFGNSVRNLSIKKSAQAIHNLLTGGK